MNHRRILLVDDDTDLLAMYQRALRDHFTVDVAPGGEEAIRLLTEQGPYAVLLADRHMPCMDGLQLLTHVAEHWPDVVRIMFTGDPDPQTALDAINKGHVFSFLVKPASLKSLTEAVEDAVAQAAAVQAERDVLERTLTGTVRLLTDLLEAVDAERFGRSQKLKEDMRQFLVSLGGKGNWEYEMAASLAGIGYLTLPPSVLVRQKNGEDLQPAEMEMIQRVPEAGAELISNIPRLEGVAQIIHYQAKNFDGSGFPNDSVIGDNIPLGARILRVLTDYSDLRTRGLEVEEALDILSSRTDRYDAKVLGGVKKKELAGVRPSAQKGSAKPGGRPRVLEVTVEDLRAGHQLADDVRTKEGTLIFAAGQIITPTKLQMIRNFAKLTSIELPIRVDFLG